MSLIDLEKRACIYGDEIDGHCHVGEIKEYYVLLKGALAKVCQICSEGSETKAEFFRDIFTSFSGNLNAPIKGNRLCASPPEGYNGPRRGLQKKPTKAGKHVGYFNVKGFPALCYTDLRPTRDRVKLASIKIREIEINQK